MNAKTVKEIMISPVLAVLEDWSMDELTDYLIANNVSGAPVESVSGEVVGVVSMTDVVRYVNFPVKEQDAHDVHEYFLSSLGRQYAFEEIQAFRVESDTQVTVKDLMTEMVFSVDEDATVQDAADSMITGNIHRVLVTSGKKVVGIVTALDLVKVVRDM